MSASDANWTRSTVITAGNGQLEVCYHAPCAHGAWGRTVCNHNDERARRLEAQQVPAEVRPHDQRRNGKRQRSELLAERPVDGKGA